MEVLGALHHFAEYERFSYNSRRDFVLNRTHPKSFLGIRQATSVVLLLGGYLAALSPYSYSPAQAFSLDVVELIRYLTGQEYLGQPVNVDPMTTLVSSEGGGRYEEAEVKITLKQGELVKYVSGHPPIPTNGSTSAQTLQCGSTGIQVFRLQEYLARLGFLQHEPTGYFGDLTEAAVIKFQRAHNLVADGVAGPQTLRHLSRLSEIETIVQHSGSSNGYPSGQVIASTASVPAYEVVERSPNSVASETEASIGRELYLGSQGIAVKQLQMLLKQTGNYDGPITGYFGNLTTQAIKEFQAKHQLPVTGIVGVKTFLTLVDEMS